MNTSADNKFSVAERLERLPLTSYQHILFLIIATAWFFDCVDIAMMTFALAPIKSEFGLSTGQAGLLGSMTFAGMFFGAATAGILADRFGRCKVFQWSMCIWGLGSILCAFAPNVAVLMICRVLLGVGIAMELPVGQSLVCEMIPAHSRGKYLAFLEGFWPVGFVCTGFLAYMILPLGGWRALFIAQAIPAIFVFVVRRFLPESPRWLEEAGKEEEANAVMTMFENKVIAARQGKSLPPPIKHAIARVTNEPRSSLREIIGATYLRRTIMLWALWFFALLGFYGLTTWMGALLQSNGYTMTKSTEYITCMSMAGIPGFFFTAWLLEVWGRKPTLILNLTGSAIMAYFYGTAASLAHVIAFGLSMQFFFYGMWCVLYAYTPELYPTRIRATGSGLASSVGRIGALLGPYLVGVILPIAGQTGVFQLGAGAFMAAAFAILILGEETKGKILEEIS